MAKTPFFCIAVEGATATDDRVITREMIDQSAADYNTATYTARINCEHIRGFSPEGPFNAYGSVVALKAEDREITIGGEKQTRRALFAQFDANDQMVATVKADQKIFTSSEFQPNFAKTGRFGLVGVAITDNPASLGTDALKFSAFKPMWDARKTDPTNFFSAAEENLFSIQSPVVEIQEDAAAAGAFAAMASFFSRWTGGNPAPTPPAPPAPPVTTAPPANDNFSQLMEGLGLVNASLTALSAKVDRDVGSVRTDLSGLQTRLSTTSVTGGQPRQPATGGDAAIVTDC